MFLRFISAAFVMGSIAIAGPAFAQTQIALNPNSVIGSTGGLGSQFTPDNIFDRQTGDITEAFLNGEYWLNPNNGPANAFITFDLGAAYLLGRFDLFNTTNGFGDRGTANFMIRAANTLTAAGTNAVGQTLGSDAITLVSGTLFKESGQGRTAQSFGVINEGVAYRYLEFVPLSATAGAYQSVSYGLNELRVFDGPANTSVVAPVPEPATWAMMIGGFGAVGGVIRRRRPAKSLMAGA